MKNFGKQHSTTPGKIRELSYLLERKCLNCGTPIPDDEHAARLFCDKYYDENGKVNDCKTTWHRINDKLQREIHSNLIRDHKYFSMRIMEMTMKKGYEVTTDDLNAYDIILSNSLKQDIKKDGIAISYFLQYSITSNPVTKTHKIIRHE